MAKKPEVVTTFYANGKAVWRAEWYQQLSEDQIKKHMEDVEKFGYGIVDAITDTTGRMIKYDY